MVSKRRAKKDKKKQQHGSDAGTSPAAAKAPGGSSGPIDRDVDESPDAVEARRESQSGPGATGVPHTGTGVDEKVHEAIAAESHGEDRGIADEEADPIPLEHAPPDDADRIVPHPRHAR